MKLSPEDLFALTLAVALHLLLGAMLWFGMPNFFPKESMPVIPVHAVFLDQGRDQLAAQQAAKAKAIAEAKRKAAEEAARLKAQQEAERKAKDEAQRKVQEEAQRKAAEEAQKLAAAEAEKKVQAQRAEAARKLADEQVKKQAEAAQKKKADEVARQKAEAEKQRKLAEEKARKEAAEKKQRQDDRERQLKDALEDETRAMEDERRATAQARQDLSDSQIYQSQLFNHIQRNWIRPVGVDEDFTCKIQINQLPGGQIQGFKLLESCGNAFIDASVENAIRNSDPLPLPKNPRVFDRTLTLTFKPR